MTHAVSRYRRALVPLDGSRLAEGIIPFILDIAGPLDMDIVLLRVVSPALRPQRDRIRRSTVAMLSPFRRHPAYGVSYSTQAGLVAR
jgi:nucleotide-binding universal stress UspA family protein